MRHDHSSELEREKSKEGAVASDEEISKDASSSPVRDESSSVKVFHAIHKIKENGVKDMKQESWNQQDPLVTAYAQIDRVHQHVCKAKRNQHIPGTSPGWSKGCNHEQISDHKHLQCTQHKHD